MTARESTGRLTVLVVAVMGAVVLVTLAALAFVVGQLRSEVGDLKERLAVLAPAGSPAPAVARPEDPTPEPVTVITHLSEGPGNGPEPTTARIVSLTLARPLITVAALSHGVRRALGDEQRSRIRFVMHEEMRRQRKLRRRRRTTRADSPGWRP